jgi:hypothetical protein
MDGWIKLYRELLNNKIWKEKPYTRGQSWIDMLLRCNHTCVQMSPKHQGIWVLRGQFLSSNVKLAEAWGWDEKKVRRFMDYLVKEIMVKYFPYTKFTIYEIVKFAELQSLDAELFQAADAEQNAGIHAKKLSDELIPARDLKKSENALLEKALNECIQGNHAEQMPSRCRADAEQMPTNNNDNNDNNDKDIKNICVDAPAEKPKKGGAQKTGKGEYTDEFEAFWGNYPRKIEKKGAFRVWNTRLKEGVLSELMINAAKGYSAFCKKNKTEEKYIKHPSTFLGPAEPYVEYTGYKSLDKPKSQVILK